MTIRTTDKFTELIPDDGKYIALANMSEIYDSNVYLSTLDSVENYIEIDEEQYQAIVTSHLIECANNIEQPENCPFETCYWLES